MVIHPNFDIIHHSKCTLMITVNKKKSNGNKKGFKSSPKNERLTHRMHYGYSPQFKEFFSFQVEISTSSLQKINKAAVQIDIID